ncbi:hypothetical protein LUZ63_010178 [Rhynchospora breviuscula]|uniref:TTI1 N-terminal TPR domain-containing protein n=1 Tax=Rhynchospora breviuscula TaxID=2022672 RepID=A0A9Q0HPT8_9POAL|nr:hypothetical protein LUZ63_010178 [Rhynchospora breviuscula]
MEGEGIDDQLTLERVYARLKPFSIDLLELLQNPKRKRSASASFLLEMASFLRCAPASTLQPCFDYTLFPLLLLLDAALKCRHGKRVNVGESTGVLEVSDGITEGVLTCIEELLKKCHLNSVNQMVMILKKLTSGAMLSHTDASEEFRIGIIRSFKAMLLRMQPCSVSFCVCKRSVIPHTAVEITHLDFNLANNKRYGSTDSPGCLLAFLQSPDASAAVGHWFSLLLQTAEVEASRGHHGSSVLRKEAFLSLRVLIAKVGTADALAFFLPGIVSRISKALYVSKSVMSGASKSSITVEHAILGLTESLIIVLSDKESFYALGSSHNMEDASTESVLDLLRHMPTSLQNQSKDKGAGLVRQPIMEDMRGSTTFVVKRTKEWIQETAVNVDKMLSATFPHLCMHPSEKIRKTLVDGIRELLSFCSRTLSGSKLLLLECLCLLACDDAVTVSEAAQESLESLLSGESFLTEQEISDIFTRLMEKLPRLVLGSDETVAVSHARRLLALLFYAGPDFLANHLISYPTNATRLFDCIGLSLSPNSQFSGSFDRLMVGKPLSAGYLLSVAELKAGTGFNSVVDNHRGFAGAPVTEVDCYVQSLGDGSNTSYELPHLPPWFIGPNSEKLYHALAGILRLVGLSTNVCSSDQSGRVNLSILADVLLEQFRKLVSELRTKDFNQEEFHRSSLGQLLRETSVAVCMLNEMIYGVSNQAVNASSGFFHSEKGLKIWDVKEGRVGRDQIIQCIGNALHEYMAQEVWDLPINEGGELDLPLYLFRDVKALHQVIIEGIGIFGMILGKDFAHSGFVHSSLYLLLRKLISSCNEIRITSDAVLQCLSVSSGYISVGQLVVSNADYIVDSFCRELRHLDVNPHVPDVLSSMLSYIGAAHDILPLLEEPMRAVSVELEVLGRNKHSHLTVPFLKAVNEIAKACMREANGLPKKAESFFEIVNSKVCAIQNLAGDNRQKFEISDGYEKEHTTLEYWEDLMCKLNETRRYRRIVGSLAGSCMLAAAPLLSSLSEPACLVSLDIVQNAVASIADVEAAFKHEKETKAGILKAIDLLLLNELEDREEDDSDENRLLPAMNKLWPYYIICLKNKMSPAVVKKCTKVLSKSVEISGGDFFVRRFHTDGPTIWKLLTLSPFNRKPNSSNSDKNLILLPYRAHPISEEPMAEVSSQKIQAAVLDMIADLSFSKRSAVALESVLKRVTGLVVGVACSTMSGLRKNASNALVGLSNIDSDLVWLLVADVYYSLNRTDVPLQPDQGLHGITDLLPPPATSREFLYVQYGGDYVGFDLDPKAVELVFKSLQE